MSNVMIAYVVVTLQGRVYECTDVVMDEQGIWLDIAGTDEYKAFVPHLNVSTVRHYRSAYLYRGGA